MPRLLATAEPPPLPPRLIASAFGDNPAPRLIPVEEVATLLGVSKRSVERLDARKRMPAPRWIGHAKRWDREELTAWLSRPKADGKLMTRAEWAPVWAQIVRTKSK